MLKVSLTNLSKKDRSSPQPASPSDSASQPTNGAPPALPWRLDIAVQTPAHAALGDLLSYASAEPMPPGTLVRVPLGKREVLGVVWNEPVSLVGAEPDMALKPVGAALDALAPLGEAWRDLVAFAARYYQRSIGEIALAALPPQLRDLSTTQLARRLKRKTTAGPVAETAESANLIALSAGADGRPGAHRGRSRYFFAGRQHRQRQDRGLPALRGRPARARPRGAGAGDGARDQPHAAARSPLQGPLRRRSGGVAAQRHDQPAAARELAGGAQRRGAHRAGHAHGGVRVDPGAQAHRGRRRARPELQAAGRRALFRARPRRVARPARKGQGDPGLGHALARKLAPEPARRRRRPGRALRAAGHAHRASARASCRPCGWST